ncbi:MAG: NAD(P)/FAD-dependent oxidoreductase, partial [Gammaproteobacteria bacterium]
MDVEVAVIGAGAVGLACAMELARTRRVAVVERHGAIGLETSSHNSGVIHAGIYYRPGSYRARLCVEGVRLLRQFCRERDIRVFECGK